MVARKYFDQVLYNVPEKPNFSKAFKWIFRQSQSKFVFHLEDDWELLRDVDLYDMLAIMERRPELATLRLPYRISTHNSKNWTTFFDFDGEIFMCPEEKKVSVGYCGHPSLVRGEFIRTCAALVNPNKNPEKEFHPGGPYSILSEVVQYNYGVYQKPDEKEYVKDIGRHWLINTKWRKRGIKAFFNEWEKVNE